MIKRFLASVFVLASVVSAHAYWQSRAQVAISNNSLGLQTNLSAFWAFASQPSVDSTANGNNLSTGAGTPGTTTGPGVNSAVSYNGSSNNTIVNNTSLQLGPVFSINFWVDSTSTGDGVYLSKDDGGFGQREWYIGTNFTGSANVYSFTFYDSGVVAKTCDSAVSATSGYKMVSATWDGTSQKIYVNGVLSVTCTPTVTLFSGTTSAIFIGKDGDSGFATTGSMALVGLWKNRVLNSTDFTNLYNSASGLSYAAMN